MNQKTKTILKSFLIVFLFSASIAAIATWTPPGVFPSNVANPFNVGDNTQMKTGGGLFGFLGVDGLLWAKSNMEVDGNAQFDGNINVVGSIKIGSVTAGGRDGSGSESGNVSALVELNSTTQGFLPPRMTMAQRNAIVTPATGLLIFQTNNLPGFYYFNGVAWVQLAPVKDGGSGL